MTETRRPVKIGCGQGFWGDDLDAPRRLLEQADLDYLVMDFLAEITMSILQKQKRRDPRLGYATDIIPMMRELLPLAVAKGTKIITNAGGVNVQECARSIVEVANELGISDKVRVGIVTGDDLMPNIDQILATEDLVNSETGRPFSDIRGSVVSANAYLGSDPIRDALAQGATVVICGRSTDTALALGPLMYEYGWAADDWDRLASGIVAGHLLECSGQITGGNHQAAWKTVPGLNEIGYPIVEVDESGAMTITKPAGTGGLVTEATVTEQLLYEIGDPKAILTPDVTVDWTSFHIAQVGSDRVRLSGARGTPPPPTLKVSAAYEDGYSTALMWVYAWPDTVAKSQAAIAKIEYTVRRLGLKLDATRADVFGMNAVHGRRAKQPTVEPGEVIVRYAVRSTSRSDLERLAAEVAPMMFGPPGMAGFLAGGRARVNQIIGYWPSLVSVDAVKVSTEIMTAHS
jgi:hypothetical protein